MDRNNHILKILFASVAIATLVNCSGENKKEKKEYINVNWIPKSKDIAGTYILNRDYHEKLPKDSIFLKLKSNNTFIAKNYFYTEFGWDSIKIIPYAEGIWSIEKNEYSSNKKINLIFNSSYKQFNGVDEFENMNNIFLKIIFSYIFP